MRDWTPLAFYGTNISVVGPGTGYVILYPLPDYSAGDAEFLVEDEEETGLFCERIVGEVLAFGDGTEVLPISWQLMPLGVDYDTPDVLRPFTTDWSMDNTEWANLRFWDRRRYRPTDEWPALVDHPYWTRVDINPRQLLGARRNLWPVLVLRNVNDTTVRFTHTLRAFWK